MRINRKRIQESNESVYSFSKSPYLSSQILIYFLILYRVWAKGRLEFDLIWKQRLIKRLLSDIRVLAPMHSKAIITPHKVANIISSLKLSEYEKSVMWLCNAQTEQLLKHLTFILNFRSQSIPECLTSCCKKGIGFSHSWNKVVVLHR